MKFLLIILLFISGCGYSSRQNEAIGQVKKVVSNTPLICNDYNDVDISLGVMVKGVGSMSSQDMWFYVPNQNDINILKKANESGKLVKFTYDTKRFRWCVDERQLTHVEILEN